MLVCNVDYRRGSVQQIKKTVFFVMMQIALSCPAARELGVVFMNRTMAIFTRICSNEICVNV